MKYESKDEKDKRKKKRESQLEAMIFNALQKSAKQALDAAFKELLGDWR